jgi:beta-1,4-mannosyl-glycoprotein beta-1,4-N-acetylglucosaminyltransferase
MKIYDCFLFFDELDLLELRLDLLYSHVDQFVIVESAITFQGDPKPFNLEKAWPRFIKYADKITYLKIEAYSIDFSNLPYISEPKTSDEVILNRIYQHIKACPHFDKKREFWWGNDFFQRECLWRALDLLGPSDDDFILISDVDEIPDPDNIETLKKSVESGVVLCLQQHEFCYFLNYYHNTDWLGTCCFIFGSFKNHSLNSIRFSVKRDEKLRTSIISNGGWHFTSLGTVEKIKQKIKSWGHKEFNTLFTLRAVEYNVKYGYDIFRRAGFGRLRCVSASDPIFGSILPSKFSNYPHLMGPEISKEPWLTGLGYSSCYFLGRIVGFFQRKFSRLCLIFRNQKARPHQ